MSPHQVQVRDRSPLLAHAAAWGHGETQGAGSCVGTLGPPRQHCLGPKGDLGKEGRMEGRKGHKERVQAAPGREALGQVGDRDGRARIQGERELWTGGQGCGTGPLLSPGFPPPSFSPRICLERERWRRMMSTAPLLLESPSRAAPSREHPGTDKEPDDPQGTFNLGQDSYWINTMNM